MKEKLGLHTNKAIQDLIKALAHEHPDIIRNGGNIRSQEYGDFVISISKVRAIYESYQGTEFFRSLNISALGAGAPCPKCGGSGKV